jgi:hypothetical protein
MKNSRFCQVYTHFQAWQKAEDSLRTNAREIWATDRKRAEGMIEAAERIREDRLAMSIEFAEEY